MRAPTKNQLARAFLRVGLGLCCLLSCSWQAHAIERLKVFRGQLLLEGQIELGDFAKVVVFLSNHSVFAKINGGVFLASPGGNVIEAVKIGSLFRELGLKTAAPADTTRRQDRLGVPLIGPDDLVRPMDYLCASACFLVYAGGIDRTSEWRLRLAIHRPALNDGFSRKSTQPMREAALDRLEDLISLYLSRMGLSPKVAKMMYAVPADEIHWITETEFGSLVSGRTTELDEQLDARCGHGLSRADEATAAYFVCRQRVEKDIAEHGWRRLFFEATRQHRSNR